MHNDYTITHLKQLESEAIFILRETAAQFEKPVLLFSGGKDSIVMAHLAKKAFWPAKLPFQLMHVDTGHNFPETMAFRDKYVAELGAELIVASVQESIDQGKVVEEKGPRASRNGLQTVALLEGIEKNKFDAALGGGRRDEEKARAKERFFSHRDAFGNGIRRTNAQSFGISSTDARAMVSNSGSFRSVTGRRWTFGNTSRRRTSNCHTSISRTSVIASFATV